MTAIEANGLLLVVAAALVDPDGRVLVAQRPEGKSMGGLWEFPGGKVEAGEAPEAALIRELHEELGIAVKEPCLAPFTFASHTYAAFHLLMPLYVCRRWDGTPRALAHAALKWLTPRELLANADAWPMPAADLPLLPMLRDLL
jgi:8-oxo-dGTP diphosphatase